MHLSMQSPTIYTPSRDKGGALLVKPSPGGGNFVNQYIIAVCLYCNALRSSLEVLANSKKPLEITVYIS